ncbi:hypothetical protein LJR175_007606 [Variovorax sp. LjRoot175]|uniref:hypothetical protein n=1 Tax=Variovorax sp. LjRoot175 TaxID=3342276 RepID=UPI003ED002FD
MNVEDRDFRGAASGQIAVEALATLLRDREKTKRLLIVAACVLFALAALIMMFAPPGRETLSYALGGALLVFALGAIGAAQFKFKLPGVTVETNHSADRSETIVRTSQEDLPR